jgi:hypothetical protein
MFKIIDRPTIIPIECYNDLIDKLINELIKDDTINSIFQVGSIKNPGISDLDLFCIYNSGSQNKKNYRKPLSKIEKQILTHNIFVLNIEDVSNWLSYNQLSNYRLLHGEINIFKSSNNSELDNEIKIQIALEYLLKMYIALHIQITYGIIKLRTFLLEAKAISFDLELLGINSGKLYDMVCQIIDLRNDWFKTDVNDRKLYLLIKLFFEELEKLLLDLFTDNNFNLPHNEVILGKNLKIYNGDRLKKSHYGYVLPKTLSFFGKKYINLQNRFNKFKYELSITIPQQNSKINKRFVFNKNIYLKSLLNFPHFVSPISSLRMFYS